MRSGGSLLGIESSRLSCVLIYRWGSGLVVGWDVLRVRLETELERAAADELVGVD